MKRWAILALLGLLATAALAADNATLITPCGTGCVTVRAKDIGLGVQSPVYILGDTSGNPIYGTAGTANANVLTVQGIAAMTALKVDGSGVTQPVSGTVTANAGTGTFTVGGTVTANQGGAPWSENTTQFGGVALSTGTGASGTGIPRVTVANDSNILATQSGTWTVQQGGAPWQENVTQFNGTAATAKASGTNAATTDTALVVAPSPNPSDVCTSIKPISQTASTDLITSTNKLHICAILIVSATAQSVSLVEGTVTTCGTGTAALMGATTAANGMALAANGGFTHTAERPFMVTQTTADHLCLLQSGAGNVSGFISYVDHN